MNEQQIRYLLENIDLAESQAKLAISERDHRLAESLIVDLISLKSRLVVAVRQLLDLEVA